MSHLVSPNAYRLGRTQMWGNVGALILESLLWRSQISYPLGLIFRTAVWQPESVYILYYPVFALYRHRSRFLYPRFYRHLRFSAYLTSLVIVPAKEALESV